MENRMNLSTRRGFTLIELLVVIAIIALLIGILLPALGAARNSAQALVAASNARNISQGVAVYGSTNRDFVPPAYTYPTTETGLNWNRDSQTFTVEGNPDGNNGYAHWSYFLFDGAVPEDAFESPKTTNNGAPRTYHDPNDPFDQEVWQNDNQTLVTDRQVPRIAFTVNGAIMPRNKFNATSQGRLRNNVLVRGRPHQRRGQHHHRHRDGRRRRVALRLRRDHDRRRGRGEQVPPPDHPLQGSLWRWQQSVYDVGNVNFPRKAFRYYVENEVWTDEVLQQRGAGVIADDSVNLNIVSRAHNGRSNFAFVGRARQALLARGDARGAMWGDRFYSLTPALENGTAALMAHTTPAS
jgi:prepilin-type N-terminal cleavage/methylation domain-containing protein